MMQTNMIEKARLGRVEALAALHLLRSKESEFESARRSQRRGSQLRVDGPRMYHHAYDCKNIFALAA